MKGGHPKLQATTSHPVTSSLPPRSNDDDRGSSLGRNVLPPSSQTSNFPPAPSSLARPPSHVSEEMSDIDTDTETSGVPVARSSSVKLAPSGTGQSCPKYYSNGGQQVLTLILCTGIDLFTSII